MISFFFDFASAAVNGILRVYEKSRRAGRIACLVAAISGKLIGLNHGLPFEAIPPATVQWQTTALATPVGNSTVLKIIMTGLEPENAYSASQPFS